MGIKEILLGKTLGTLWDLFGLQKYISILKDCAYTEIKKRTDVSIEIYKEMDFWKAALGTAAYPPFSKEKLPSGAVVTLKNFQITEWVPLNPGRYWTEAGFAARDRAEDYRDLIYFDRKQPMLAYDPKGKAYMMVGGVGTVKLKPKRIKFDTRSYSLLCATSSGNCWMGIPILVSDQVYESFQTALHRNKSVEADISGIYQIRPFKPEDLLICKGVEIPEKEKQIITDCSGIPQYAIFIESVLPKKFRSSNIPLKAIAWTLFRGVKYHLNNRFFGFTYHTFDPLDEISHNKARNFILNYFENFGGEIIITDYDETMPSFCVFQPTEIEAIDLFRKKLHQKRIEEYRKKSQERIKQLELELHDLQRQKEEGGISEFKYFNRKSLREREISRLKAPPVYFGNEECAPIVKKKLGIQNIDDDEYYYIPYYGRCPSPFLSLKSIIDGSIEPKYIEELLQQIYFSMDSENITLQNNMRKKDIWEDSAPYYYGE